MWQKRTLVASQSLILGIPFGQQMTAEMVHKKVVTLVNCCTDILDKIDLTICELAKLSLPARRKFSNGPFSANVWAWPPGKATAIAGGKPTWCLAIVVSILGIEQIVTLLNQSLQSEV